MRQTVFGVEHTFAVTYYSRLHCGDPISVWITTGSRFLRRFSNSSNDTNISLTTENSARVVVYFTDQADSLDHESKPLIPITVPRTRPTSPSSPCRGQLEQQQLLYRVHCCRACACVCVCGYRGGCAAARGGVARGSSPAAALATISLLLAIRLIEFLRRGRTGHTPALACHCR
ncbi:hypothetical protein EVAR_99603_1 [Eumeta japonica]|uniref:Uncharacterized protein n=1 Tax=Eumeta variegata TaxID=151549 RepID=A0A4C1ZZL7_EUMVA|nr:hypothetical protein EVAR_99603_1 [Eumeta japonica]